MSWIKIDSTLAEKPQVRKMARMLKLDRRWVAGGLVSFWGWCDLHSADGTTMLTDKEVDELCGHKGFARALVAVGWLEEDANGELSVTDWEEHNGESAKKRALHAKRQDKYKNSKKADERVAQKLTQEASAEMTSERQQMRHLEKEKEYKESLSLTREPKESRPRHAEEVQKVMASSPNCGLKGQELANCALRFFDSKEACGWVTPQGLPIHDWKAAARAYLAAWQDNLRNRRAGSTPTKRERKDCNDPADYDF